MHAAGRRQRPARRREARRRRHDEAAMSKKEPRRGQSWAAARAPVAPAQSQVSTRLDSTPPWDWSGMTEAGPSWRRVLGGRSPPSSSSLPTQGFPRIHRTGAQTQHAAAAEWVITKSRRLPSRRGRSSTSSLGTPLQRLPTLLPPLPQRHGTQTPDCAASNMRAWLCSSWKLAGEFSDVPLSVVRSLPRPMSTSRYIRV